MQQMCADWKLLVFSDSSHGFCESVFAYKHMSAGATEPGRGVRSPGAGITGSCGLAGTEAENQTPVLCKSNTGS